ncbi:MAG: energy transducer TonB [Melioribacteraceae bacterium]
MKTKIFLFVIIISFTGLIAQQKDVMKLQKADESGFIEVDKAPELISQLKPAYPQLAKLSGIQGTVYLKLLIDEKGNVDQAIVLQGVKDMIDEAALASAKEAKFSPAMLNNKPVKVWVILPVAFKLDVDKKTEGKLLKYDELGPPPSNVKVGDPDINEFILVEKLPEMIESANPQYPEIAKRAGIKGNVFVKVLIDKDGSVKKAVVIKSENEIFNQSSVDAATKSKFTPALNNGQPVAVWLVIPYKFDLDPADMESKSFERLEDAEKYYQGYIRGLEGMGLMKTEKVENILFYGNESALYKIIGNSYDKYSFITRKGLNVVKIMMNTLDDLKLAVNKNMDNTFKKLEVKNAKKK